MRVFLSRWCVRPLGILLSKFTRWLLCFIAASKLLVLCRWYARHFGEYLKRRGKELVLFGEKESQSNWGTPLLNRLPLARIEVSGRFPGEYCGVISAAFFRCSPTGPERKIVLRVKWVSEPPGQRLSNFWDHGDECNVVLDPILSPLHVLPDGTPWFMWPTGETGVIRLGEHMKNEMKKYVRVKDDEPQQPRERRESHFKL